jgi:hypothetical protein
VSVEVVKAEVVGALVAAEQTHSKGEELVILVIVAVKKDSPKLVEHPAKNILKKQKTESLAQETPP